MQCVVEVALGLGTFRNVDLFERGHYAVRATLELPRGSHVLHATACADNVVRFCRLLLMTTKNVGVLTMLSTQISEHFYFIDHMTGRRHRCRCSVPHQHHYAVVRN